jgi:uncharacterized repeat protein (TIGR03803 family)
MRRNKFSVGLKATFAICAVTLFVTTNCLAGEKVLYGSFREKDKHGADLMAAVILDVVGNVYGTTPYGGGGGCKTEQNRVNYHNCGVVYELTPRAGGGWAQKVLYSFKRNGKDGSIPLAGLTFDRSGNLYGTTSSGGTNGGGTVFKLTSNGDGSWTESVLYSFCSLRYCADGHGPQAAVIFDKAGNLYGTTVGGGTSGYGVGGTLFRLTPNSGGSWTESVLYSFCSLANCTDGGSPVASVIFDGDGNLYGTTSVGGADGSGAAFELVPQTGGGWAEKVLHSFDDNGKDGWVPYAGLVFDASGNLYGTTVFGGAEGDGGGGTVFELMPRAGGGWTEKVLHTFNGSKGDGPYAGVVFDASGNLYGTTLSGGDDNFGTVFELMPRAGGGWGEKVLHSFNKDGKDGIYPQAGVIIDALGNLYGTTFNGGHFDQGTVFEITP